MRMIDADVLLTRLSDWRDSETPKAGDLPHIKERQKLIAQTIERAIAMVNEFAGDGDSAAEWEKMEE